MPYAVTADVALRLAGRTIDASSAPTATTVTAWIEEAEAELEGTLAAVGLTVPVTAARGISICKAKVISRVAGRVERAYASGTDMETQDVAADLMKEFEDFLALISDDPGKVATMLGQTGGAAGGKGIFRSYVVNNSHGKTVDDGDFDPVFSKDDLP